MSEYIIDFLIIVVVVMAITGVTEWVSHRIEDPFVREEIVRCCDCKHYEYWEFRDGRTAHDCARGGDYLFDAEPDGFCAWGEKKE